jgi:hypothetical protein
MKWGRPCGTCPTDSTGRPNRPNAAIPAATAISGAGRRGVKRSSPSRITIVAIPTASAASDVSGRLSAMRSRFWRKFPFAKWTPSSFGTWSSTITVPIPALKPISTGSEMKFATKPRRSSEASARKPPTRSVNVAVAVSNAA